MNVGAALDTAPDAQLQTVSFDPTAFTMESVQRAALKFTNLCSFEFHQTTTAITAAFRPLSSSIELDSNSFVGIFRNEVLDQQLRAAIAKETETERNLILAYAFSNTKLLTS